MPLENTTPVWCYINKFFELCPAILFSPGSEKLNGRGLSREVSSVVIPCVLGLPMDFRSVQIFKMSRRIFQCQDVRAVLTLAQIQLRTRYEQSRTLTDVIQLANSFTIEIRESFLKCFLPHGRYSNFLIAKRKDCQAWMKDCGQKTARQKR